MIPRSRLARMEETAMRTPWRCREFCDAAYNAATAMNADLKRLVHDRLAAEDL